MLRQLFEYHPVFAYRLIPHLKIRVPHESGGYLLRTNAQGYRCRHDFLKEKSPTKRRVLLFGDSFTAGDGVSNGKRFGDFLEQMVPDLEVYNFGLSGSGTDQQYLIYQEEAREIEHDILIISVLVGNIRRIVAKYRWYADEEGQTKLYAKPYFTLDGGDLCLHGVPPSKAPISPEVVSEEEVDQGGRFYRLRGLVKRLGLKEIVQRVTRYQPLPHFNSPENSDWLLMKSILGNWIEQHNKPVLLFVIPVHQYIEETSDPASYLARFGELAQETSCIWHSPLEDLLRHDKETRRAFRFEKDIHLTPRGHEALASSLAPVLENLLPKREAI